MKKYISVIISTVILITYLPVYAVDDAPCNDYPADGAELGYLFSLKSEPDALFDPNDYDGIEAASEMANIYYADTIEHIKAIEDIVDIDIVTENWSLSTPEPIIEPIYEDNFVSLFSDNEETLDSGELDEANLEEQQYPNDTLLERQWHYDAVKAQTFRDNNIDGHGVKIGIIDSGLTTEFKTFYDFEGIDIQVGINICAKIDKNEDLLYDTTDNQTHGTSVASIICAKANNNHGIAGLTDGCTVIPYKVEDSNCSEFANSGYALIVAIEEAYKDNCDVVNISQAGELTNQSQIELENSVVNKSEQNGMIIVAGTGNDGKTTNAISYPAACDNVIGVGSIEPICEKEHAVIDASTEMIKPESEYTEGDSSFVGWLRRTVQDLPDNAYQKTESSTANDSVFVCAPGSNMTLACTSTRITQNFNISSGTSFSTPIVTSAAIGVKQIRPYIDIDMFKEILIATAVDLEDEGYDINTGYGMVNFENIYNYVSQMPLTAPERTPEVYIDYENEQLIDFPINREYTINGEAVAVSEDGTLPIKEEWFGTTISIVKKASSESYEDSEPQELEIPARPNISETVFGTETGITNNSEYSRVFYKRIDSETWHYFDKENVNPINLSKGKYIAKINSSSTSFASLTEEIQVGRQTPGITIDYKNEALTNFEDGESYSVNGEDILFIDNAYPIDSAWLGTTITLTRKASDTYYNDAVQELEIPAIPSAPNVSGGYETITDITAAMEYRAVGTEEWITCTDETETLPYGDYEVRIKAADTSFASETATVTVLPVPAETVVPTIEPTTEPTAEPNITPIPTEKPNVTSTETPKETSTVEPTTIPTQEPTVTSPQTPTPTETPKADDTDYELVTSITPREETNGLVCAVENTTNERIDAVGIMAVYSNNGILKGVSFMHGFDVGENITLINKPNEPVIVKFFVWDNLQSMKPADRVKLSEYTISLE